jgi:hypothetical protein
VEPLASNEAKDIAANEVSTLSKDIAISPGSANAPQTDEHLTPVNDKQLIPDEGISSQEQRPNHCALQTAVLDDNVVSSTDHSQDPSIQHESQPQLSEQAANGSPNGLAEFATSNASSKQEPAMNIDLPTQTTTTSQATTSSVLSPLVTQPVVPRTPQEITLAELRAQKAALLASLAAVPAVQVLIEENASLNADTANDEPTEAEIMAVANKMVKDHIKLLHEYNELKDVGQGLMGLIADQRGVRIVEVNEEFGIDVND